MTNWWRCMAVCRPSAWLPARPTSHVGATCMTLLGRVARPRGPGPQQQWEAADAFCTRPSPLPVHRRGKLGELFAQRSEHALAAQCLANALRLQRGEDSVALVRGGETPPVPREEQPLRCSRRCMTPTKSATNSVIRGCRDRLLKWADQRSAPEQNAAQWAAFLWDQSPPGWRVAFPSDAVSRPTKVGIYHTDPARISGSRQPWLRGRSDQRSTIATTPMPPAVQIDTSARPPPRSASCGGGGDDAGAGGGERMTGGQRRTQQVDLVRVDAAQVRPAQAVAAVISLSHARRVHSTCAAKASWIS